MRPPANEPTASMRRRIYQILQLRYEQQFAQKEVAVQLGLSVRQYRRLQHAAIEALAFHLLEQYDLADRIANIRSAGAAIAGAASAATDTSDAPAAVDLPESLQWILALSPTETTDLRQVLPELIRLVEPLAIRNRKQVTLYNACAQGNAAIHPLVFRQAMLHLLNSAILNTSGGEVNVSTSSDRWHVIVTVHVPGSSGLLKSTSLNQNPEEDMVQKMLHACHASLLVNPAGESWQATLTCHCDEQPLLLVVDDHLESTDLLQRYTEGTRYRLVACHDPKRALEMAQEHRPLLILLDVMMPDVDGWEVLSRLKQHEATASIPVWVCTVLDQSELAFSLGADGFLRKPVTRQSLLATLDAQSTNRVPARH